MQTRASGLAKEASSDLLKRSLSSEGWKPTSASSLCSNPAVPDGTALCTCCRFQVASARSPLAELPEGSADKCPWRIEGACKPLKGCCPRGTWQGR